MVLVCSTTKGLAAMTLAVAHSRGWLDYEERVCAYWPEFAQQGKETITVRQLLAHQAGLFALDVPTDRSLIADLDRSAPAIPPARGFYDECMMAEVQFSLGFLKSSPSWPLGSEGSFGAPGAGGSLGFADPRAGIGYAYVTSQGGSSLTGDPRDLALRNALYMAISRAPEG